MIIKVNTNGLSIDVSMSKQLIEVFGTTMATIPSGFISKFRIQNHGLPTEFLQIVDKNDDEYKADYSIITSINGQTGFTSNIDVFNYINDLLFGF